MYAAVIGDIRESRALRDRRTVQESLEAALRAANETYSGSIASAFLITLGDEFQGLLTNAFSAVSLMHFIRDRVPQAAFRFGVGIGGLTTPLRSPALGMDGPAFYRARAAVERARADGLLVAFDSGAPVVDDLLIGTYRLIQHIESGWTERQRAVVMEFRRLGRQEAVAAALGIEQSTVSRHLTRAGYGTVRLAEQAVAHALEDLQQKAGAAWERNPPF